MGFVNGRRITHQGLTRRHFSVGAGKGFDFTNVQSALDAISDNTLANPYLITVAAGIYDLGGTPITHNKSYVDISGEHPNSTRLVKTAAGADPAPAAFNIAVGAAGSPGVTQNVTVSNLGIYNRMAGGTGTGSPPEPALGVGKTADSTQAWDEIRIENCHIVGNHDGLQLFNYTTTRGRCYVRSNLIKAVHDAFTLKCTGEVLSSGNQIVCDDTGLDELAGTGYSNDLWKTTGIHFGVGSAPSIPIDPVVDKFISVGDSIVVKGTGNSYGPSGSPTQRWCAGVLWYNLSYHTRFIGVNIDLSFNEIAATVPTVAGVILENVTTADGVVVFQGGSIYVENLGASGTSPTTVSCVRVNAGAGAGTPRVLRMAGTTLGGRNLASGGTCYGLLTAHANARIYAQCYSSLTNSDISGTGTIAQWVPTPQGGGITTFTAQDATPSVKDAKIFKTANASATTITAFDDGRIGQEIFVLINDANTTIDFTSTTLKGNSGGDWTPTTGDSLTAVFDGTNWYCRISDNTA